MREYEKTLDRSSARASTAPPAAPRPTSASRRERRTADARRRRDLVFIGGTGRSGTHALARLLGHHSHFADVPIEARFHCNKRGMPDLLEGRITLRGYLAKLRGFWWHRVRVDGQPRGLYNLLRRSEFDAATERFEAAFDGDPVGACRELYLDLLWPRRRAPRQARAWSRCPPTTSASRRRSCASSPRRGSSTPSATAATRPPR